MSGNDRRRQLIDVAIDLFSRKGFGGTTTREIAAAAGVTEAIIFRHFATKQDLYKAILDTRCAGTESQTWIDQVRSLMATNDDAAVFRSLITQIVSVCGDDPRFERLMLHAALEGHELAIMHHNQFALPIGMELCEYIARRQSEDGIDDFDPMAVVLAIAGVGQFYSQQKYLYQCANFPVSDESVIEGFVAILMKGLKK